MHARSLLAERKAAPERKATAKRKAAPERKAPTKRKSPAEHSRNGHRHARAPSAAPLREQHCCKNEDDDNEDA
jgi:hypothetical protein